MASFEMFGDQFLESIGVNIDDFPTQPDPDPFKVVKPEPAIVAEEISDDILDLLGVPATPADVKPPEQLLTLHQSPPSAAGRFAKPITTAKMEEMKKKRIPKKTQQSTRYGVSVWRDWALNRNQCSTLNNVEVGDKFFIVPVQLSRSITAEEMDFWLARFVWEIRKQDGTPYPPNTLYVIVTALLRHFREELGCHDMNFLDKKDSRFAEFRKALDARMKELAAAGVGAERRQADPLTQEDEDKLWTTGTISTNTSMGLSYCVFYYNCKVFGLRGMDEHRRLQIEQYKFGTDVSGKYLLYTGRICKNVQGGLNHRQVDVKRIKQHADNTNERCVVNLFETYINSLPHQQGSFYRRPMVKSTVPKFTLQPVGKNTLSTYIKTMCAKAGVLTAGRNLTNHSGKVTCATQMWAAGFDEQTIMARTGHRSNAVRAYKRPSSELLKDVSNQLQPPQPSPYNHPTAPAETTTSDVLATPSMKPTVSPPRRGNTNIAIGSRLSISHPNGLNIVLDL
ncbi:zinc finger MYM-type protein 3-like [Branchiostoma lanceolatum]|uniref:zinc finger MYM-type protein 3-like n=1 Tax=Branchiostoma lanceolatum TaxID=7740 RepID=UPI0034555D1B